MNFVLRWQLIPKSKDRQVVGIDVLKVRAGRATMLYGVLSTTKFAGAGQGIIKLGVGLRGDKGTILKTLQTPQLMREYSWPWRTTW